MSTLRNNQSTGSPRAVVVATIAAAVIAAAAVLFAIAHVRSSGSAGTAPAPAPAAADVGGGHAADPAHTAPARIRTLTLHAGREPAPSATAETMRALLIEGHAPKHPVEATVLTDEDCAPDAKGVSHCRNRLELPGGKTITVRHPHRMHDVPCMTPGETVRVEHSPGA